MTAWCILRTSGPKTLPLARSLAEAGFDAWTPVHVISRRRGHSRERIESDASILPTFVFVPADRLPDLVRALAMPIRQHPDFSIFRHAGRIPLVADADIAALRTMESIRAKQRQDAKDRAARDAMRKKRHLIPVGDTVSMKEGPFGGLYGRVDGGNEKEAVINFGLGLVVKIATWRIDADVVDGAHPVMGAAA